MKQSPSNMPSKGKLIQQMQFTPTPLQNSLWVAMWLILGVITLGAILLFVNGGEKFLLKYYVRRKALRQFLKLYEIQAIYLTPADQNIYVLKLTNELFIWYWKIDQSWGLFKEPESLCLETDYGDKEIKKILQHKIDTTKIIEVCLDPKQIGVTNGL